LRDYLGRVEANPERLEEIESRLAAIDKLKRKYGGSVGQILAFGEDGGFGFCGCCVFGIHLPGDVCGSHLSGPKSSSFQQRLRESCSSFAPARAAAESFRLFTPGPECVSGCVRQCVHFFPRHFRLRSRSAPGDEFWRKFRFEHSRR